MIELSDYLWVVDPFRQNNAQILEKKLSHHFRMINDQRRVLCVDLFSTIDRLGGPFKKSLRDPLSDYLDVRPMPKIQKSHYESIVCKDVISHFIGFDPLNLIESDLILYTRNAFEVEFKRNWSFRKVNITNPPDKNGEFTKFPNFNHLDDYIKHTCEIIRLNFKEYPLLSSCYFMIMLIGIHPFVDGNGRTFRTIFNFLIRHSLQKDIYIPIYEAAASSDGGWMIALRRAWLHNNFAPIVNFLANTARIVR